MSLMDDSDVRIITTRDEVAVSREEVTQLVKCKLCNSRPVRAITTSCCFAFACRNCAAEKVRSSRTCWHCGDPQDTAHLNNDTLVRDIVNALKNDNLPSRSDLDQLKDRIAGTNGKLKKIRTIKTDKIVNRKGTNIKSRLGVAQRPRYEDNTDDVTSCSKCSKPGHVSWKCKDACFKCFRVGHKAAACPNRVRCAACWQEGHVQKNCQGEEVRKDRSNLPLWAQLKKQRKNQRRREKQQEQQRRDRERDDGDSDQEEGAGYHDQAEDAGYSDQAGGAGYPNKGGGAGYPGQEEDTGYFGGAGSHDQEEDAGYPYQERGAGIPDQEVDAEYPDQEGDVGYRDMKGDAGYPYQEGGAEYDMFQGDKRKVIERDGQDSGGFPGLEDGDGGIIPDLDNTDNHADDAVLQSIESRLLACREGLEIVKQMREMLESSPPTAAGFETSPSITTRMSGAGSNIGETDIGTSYRIEEDLSRLQEKRDLRLEGDRSQDLKLRRDRSISSDNIRYTSRRQESREKYHREERSQSNGRGPRSPQRSDVGKRYKSRSPQRSDVGKRYKSRSPQRSDVGKRFKSRSPQRFKRQKSRSPVRSDVVKTHKSRSPVRSDVGKRFKSRSPQRSDVGKRHKSRSERNIFGERNISRSPDDGQQGGDTFPSWSSHFPPSNPPPLSLSHPPPSSLSHYPPPFLSHPPPSSHSPPSSLSHPLPPSVSDPLPPSVFQHPPTSLSHPPPPSLSQPPPSFPFHPPPSLSQPPPSSLSHIPYTSASSRVGQPAAYEQPPYGHHPGGREAYLTQSAGGHHPVPRHDSAPPHEDPLLASIRVEL